MICPPHPLTAVVTVLLTASLALATDIDGVQPASLDQPRVHVLVRRAPGGEPLAAGKGEEKIFNIQAFLDTGASGFMLSKNTADALGVERAQVPHPQTNKPVNVVFHDIGVAGSEAFHVSEPLNAAMAAYHPGTDTDDPDAFRAELPRPVRAQIGPLGGGMLPDLMDLVMSNLDVIGMPAMQGKVVVMDPKPVNTFADTMRTYVYEPGAPFNRASSHNSPGIPPTNRTVRLSYVSFERFTRTEPPGAAGPTLAPNPMIGPDPTAKAAANAPPGITLAHNGKTHTASWLLDTGAAASIISTRQAAALGVTYVEGTMGTDRAALDGVPKNKQFTLTIGGIGGQKKSAGFFADELRLPTREDDVLVYRGAPVLVLDITVTDPVTNEQLTLDGVFGMNFLVATAHVTEGLMPDIGNLTEGPYEWIVFDQPKAELRLQLRDEPK